MEAVGFSDTDGDTHFSTDWEIWTVGAGAEPVWQTLGIRGVERLHTHLGDGVFINSHAGQTELDANTQYQLRSRFRDSAGSVSAYSLRGFQTGAASTVFPLQLQDIDPSPQAEWVDLFTVPVDLPTGSGLLSPGDAIIGIDLDGGSTSPLGESPANAIDGTVNKYLNFGESNSGFIVTPAAGPTTVTSFQITTANDEEARDPATWALFGTNDPIISTNHSTGTAETWTLIDNGSLALPSARNVAGPVVGVSNSTAYASYRMVFTNVKNAGAANSMQISEIQFFGGATTGDAASLRIESAGGDLLYEIEADAGPGNAHTDAPARRQPRRHAHRDRVGFANPLALPVRF